MDKYTGSVCLGLVILLVVLVNPAALLAQHSEQYPPEQVEEIYVSLDEFELITLNNGRIISRYPITTGADTAPTPRGEFEVINKLKDPWYTPSDEPAEPPNGEDNPIGSRWLGINKPSYGIHGTNEPDMIGERDSRGCIRLYNRHVETLYERVEPGTRVVIREEFPAHLRNRRAMVNPPEPEPVLADSGE